jgi:4-hydroxy-tetrahydrodipicolinate synthase
LADLDVAALQVTPVHYLFKPTDEMHLRHFASMAEVVDTPILIYNVVPHIYLSPQLLTRIMREVPAVQGVKQSAGDMKLLADLLMLSDPEDIILSAVDALLYPSFCLGAQGAIAAILAAAPATCVALWEAVQAGDHELALDLHHQLLPVWNAIEGDNLPAAVRAVMALQGRDGGLPRSPMSPASGAQIAAVGEAVVGLVHERSLSVV